MKFHKFKITVTDAIEGRGRLLIDDVEQDNVERVVVDVQAGKMAKVTVTYLARDIDFDHAVEIVRNEG